jgi:hypothetical protein
VACGFQAMENASESQRIRVGARRGGARWQDGWPNEPGSAPGSAHMGNVCATRLGKGGDT